MDARTKLQDCISNMSEEAVQKLLETAEAMMIAEGKRIDSCPYCGSRVIIRYGKKCGKQRYYVSVKAHCVFTKPQKRKIMILGKYQDHPRLFY